MSGFVVLSLLSGAAPFRAFAPRELQGLAHVVIGARESGYMILLLFFSLGSAIYMFLLVMSRYVPRALALVGLVGSALVALFALTCMLFPAFLGLLRGRPGAAARRAGAARAGPGAAPPVRTRLRPLAAREGRPHRLVSGVDRLKASQNGAKTLRYRDGRSVTVTAAPLW